VVEVLPLQVYAQYPTKYTVEKIAKFMHLNVSPNASIGEVIRGYFQQFHPINTFQQWNALACKIKHTPPPAIEYVADLRFNIMEHIQQNTTLRFVMIQGFHRAPIYIFINEAWAINEKTYYCLTSNQCRLTHT
jgi:hypothetical protein